MQRDNQQLVDNLRPYFQHRGEPNFAWKSACSAFLALPGLRGFWPMGAMDSVGNAIDQSGHGRALIYNGNPTYGAYDLAPYLNFDGAGDYLNTPDAGHWDILGNEAYVAAAQQGITMGGWFNATALPGVGTSSGLVTKWQQAVPAMQSYLLELSPGGNLQGIISDAAGNLDILTGTYTIGVDEWFFACYAWAGTGGSNLARLRLNENEETLATARAAIRNSAADFEISGFHGGVWLLNGKASMCFLCAAYLPAVTTFALYEQTRRMFYV